MKKILIVDDSPTLRMVSKQIIQDYNKDWEILEAEDAINANRIIDSSPEISLILLDIYMPNVDGITFLKDLKKKRPDFNAPIIICSTDSDTELKTKAPELGVIAWLVKPVTEENLIQCITRAIGT